MPRGLPFPGPPDDDDDDNMSGTPGPNANQANPGPSTSSGGSAAQTPLRDPAATKSHNLVWRNPNYQPIARTADSGLTDAEVKERMGLPVYGPDDAASPAPNEFGKRPKAQGPTPTSKPAEKKRKKGDKRRVVSAAQQRLEHARALQAGASTDPNSNSSNSNPPDETESGEGGTLARVEEEEGRNRKRAKTAALAKLMGGSKAVVDQLEKEDLESQPRWVQEQAEKKRAKLFPAKPTNVAQNLMDLADKLSSESEKRICQAAVLDIEKAVSVLHGQADGRTEAVLEEVHNLNKKFEDALVDAQRQSKKTCIEFQSRHFVSKGYVSNTDLFRRLNLLLHDKHELEISPYEISDVHPLRRKTAGTIIVKFTDRKEGSSYHLLSSPWLLRKNDSRVELRMDVALSPYDLNIRDALLWWMHRCRFMRATAALRGYNPDKVVPPSKWVMGVKTSATPGIFQGKFPNPSQGKKAYRFDVVATYTQLRNLMGQVSFDRYLLGGESDRWDLPKRRERELDWEKNKKKKASSEKQSEQEKQSGLQDDAIPETADEIVPDEEAEEEVEDDSSMEEEEDETTRSAKEADRALRMETAEKEDD